MRIAVIIPFGGDAELLEWTLEGYQRQVLAPGNSMEVRVGVDGGEAPVTHGSGVVIQAMPRMGAAAVRNALVKAASPEAEVLLFGSADARPESDMVQVHASTLAGTPAGSMVRGASPWEVGASPTVWDLLLAATPMVMFDGQLAAGAWHDFRQASAINMSVRRSDFAACGGFHEQLRPVHFEDQAFAYRLLGTEKKGILYEPRARVVRRHPLTLEEYLDREEMRGIMAPVLARQCTGAFGILHGRRDVEILAHAFRHWVKMDALMHRWIYQRMKDWTSVPAEALQGLAPEQRSQTLMGIYQMHVPLKQLAYRLGFLHGMKMAEDCHWQERKAEGLWRAVIQQG
jgi:hypothetical protein